MLRRIIRRPSATTNRSTARVDRSWSGASADKACAGKTLYGRDMLVSCGGRQAAHLHQMFPIPVEKRREPVRIRFFDELPARCEKALKRAPRAVPPAFAARQRLATQNQPKSRYPARAVLNSSARGLASAGARGRGQRSAHSRPTQARPRSLPAKRRLPTLRIAHEPRGNKHLSMVAPSGWRRTTLPARLSLC